MLNIYIYIFTHEYMYMTIHFNYTYWTVTSGSFGSFSNTPKSLHNFTMLTTACFTAALFFFWFHTMAWKKLCNDKSLARSIQVTEQDEKTLAGWQDGYIQLMPTKIKRNKNSNLQHTTKNSEGFLFFPGFAGGNRHVESATAWWRTCEFFSMARLREVSLLLIGFLGIVAICHLAAALREKYPSGSPRCHKATNAASEERSHLST